MATLEVSTTANQFVSAFSFIGFVLVTIPLPWHLEAWNTGTCLFMFWAGLGCLNFFINSIIWSHNAINVAPVWCDISTRIILTQSIGIPASSLCINRRLYHIASLKATSLTVTEKRRAAMVDLAIGLGIPLLQIPFAYINQPLRFTIFEQAGCFPVVYNTPVAYVLIWTWPIIIGMVSAVYCFKTIRLFNKRRSQFKELLSVNNNLNADRYFRLMCLAGIELCASIPISAYLMYINIQGGVVPWESWAVTHQDIHQVQLIPALLWRNSPILNTTIDMARGLMITCALVFFGFFGFAAEARKNYRIAYLSVAKSFGCSTSSTNDSQSTTGASKGMSSFGKSSLPILVSQETTYTTDRGPVSGFYENKNISISSLFDRVKAKVTPSSSSSSTSGSSRSTSPIHPPPFSFTQSRVHAGTPEFVQRSYDIA